MAAPAGEYLAVPALEVVVERLFNSGQDLLELYEGASHSQEFSV